MTGSAYRQHHDFSDAKKWAKRFDDPKRDGWQKPDEIVRLMALAERDVIADIGAGTGYMLRHFDRAVGQQGKVFALDVEQSLIDHMQERIAEERLQQT